MQYLQACNDIDGSGWRKLRNIFTAVLVSRIDLTDRALRALGKGESTSSGQWIHKQSCATSGHNYSFNDRKYFSIYVFMCIATITGQRTAHDDHTTQLASESKQWAGSLCLPRKTSLQTNQWLPFSSIAFYPRTSYKNHASDLPGGLATSAREIQAPLNLIHVILSDSNRNFPGQDWRLSTTAEMTYFKLGRLAESLRLPTWDGWGNSPASRPRRQVLGPNWRTLQSWSALSIRVHSHRLMPWWSILWISRFQDPTMAQTCLNFDQWTAEKTRVQEVHLKCNYINHLLRDPVFHIRHVMWQPSFWQLERTERLARSLTQSLTDEKKGKEKREGRKIISEGWSWSRDLDWKISCVTDSKQLVIANESFNTDG
jgi:hypothetical protein